jgi:3-hydroxyacyl-[acyl-carrier-protein] dehydratase
MILNFEEIKELLPQRFPILMIDRVLEFEEGRSITAIKNVSGNEMFFLGHFPDNAVMPGVLIIEAMAQTASILAKLTYKSNQKSNKYYFASANKIRFLKPVVPGDQLIIKVEVIKLTSAAGIVRAEVTVDDNVVSTGELAFAVPKEG